MTDKFENPCTGRIHDNEYKKQKTSPHQPKKQQSSPFFPHLPPQADLAPLLGVPLRLDTRPPTRGSQGELELGVEERTGGLGHGVGDVAWRSFYLYI